MQAVDIVKKYYDMYGKDETACAKAYRKAIDNNGLAISRKSIKKIAIYYPVMNRGGVQRVLSLQIPLYEKLHYEVVLITEEISEEDYYIPDTVKRFSIVSTKDIISGIHTFEERASKLAQILQKANIDVFIHHGVRLPFFVYDVLLTKCMGIYTIAEKHQIFTQGFCDMDDLFFEHIEVFRLIDRLIVLSDIEEVYWKTVGVKVSYIENPFNMELSDLQCDKDNENIVWVGRLDKASKQYLDVIDIAKSVAKRRPNVKFLIYGSGTPDAEKQLVEKIKMHNLQKNVIFCGYETDVKKIYQNARIHLMTSAYESFSMGIYESKTCGIPLVMYELPYLMLLKNRRGFLSSANGDINAIADNICLILENKELEEKLCKEAKDSLNDFSNDIVCNKWQVLFEKLEHRMREESELDIDENYKIILQTMHKHYSLGQRKYEKLLWESEQKVAVYHALKAVKAGKKLVICPFGKIGQRVKKMLNEKGIKEDYIVDNTLAKYHEDIKTLDDLCIENINDFFFLICSEREDIKKIFREQLIAIVEEKNIVNYDDELY